MTLVEALAQKLRDAGITAYALSSPDDKNPTVTVKPYMGLVVSADQAVVGDEIRVQYYVRGLDYGGAEAAAWDAFVEVLRLQERALPIERYTLLHPLQAPTYLGVDEKERHLFSFNVPLIRR